jgi:hypothetical protein
MAYSIQGKDIVLAGFESGIAETPYAGVADMRNVELISVPGEASVEPILAAAAVPPTVTALAYSADATTDTLTVASTTGWYNGMAIVLAANTATGLSNGVVYYVHNLTSTTFTLTPAPSLSGVINITTNGTGTLTSYLYGGTGSPYSYYIDRNGSLAGSNATYLVDAKNYVWVILTEAQQDIPANTLIFMGNIGVTSFTPTSGISIWNGYILLWTFQGIDYARANTAWVTSVTTAWNYLWEVTSNQSVSGRIGTLVSKEDGNQYWTSTSGLGSIIEQPGSSFNPTNAATYAITDDALLLPETDESTCIAELGSLILIGGRTSFVYLWNKIDPGFSGLLNIPENFTNNIVATSQNAYIFAGNRGRIYITNGSGVDLYKKFPDYIVGALNPIIRWQDANFGRNQLYFALTATDMDATAINTLAGIWAIDLDTDALRMINKTTNTAYQGTVRMVSERPPSNSGSPTLGIKGNGLQVGWYESTTVGVDVATTGTPYTNYEAYIQTDMIPVGTFLDPFSPSQIEWKTSVPLVAGESVRVSYRSNLSESFTVVGTSSTAGQLSDYYQANFQKVQWVQFLIELKSTASTPSYCRLTEMRVRDFPSGKDSNNSTYGKQ